MTCWSTELRDLLHAEKQLTKALPKMAEAARFDQLARAVRTASRRDRSSDRTTQRMLRSFSAKPLAPNPARE